MAKYEVPAHIEIAALKAQQVQDVDLMASGPGTPWEDRGSHGSASAYFKTAGLTLFKPVQLFKLMRRPNSITDSRGFLFINGAMWSLAVLLHAAVLMARGLVGSPATDLLLHIALILAAPFILFGLITIATNVYSPLVEGELKKGTPRTLAQNVFLYATGPSVIAPLLVPIHWAGLAVPLLWMVVVAAVGARSRMRLSVAGSIISVVLGMGVAGAVAVGAYFGINRLLWLIT